MADVFADTSGLANLVDASEAFHGLAVQIFEELRSENRLLVTTNYILNEFAATLISPLRTPKKTILQIMDDLRASLSFSIQHVDASLADRGYQLFRSREDKSWSLVDCTSFVLMKDLDLTEALTNDQHFEQAGFTRLLK